MQACQQLLYRGTLVVLEILSEHLRRRFRVTENVADRPRSGRPRVTTAADDRYNVLQHLRNRCLIASATGRQYGIHLHTVRNRLSQNVQPIRARVPTVLRSNSHPMKNPKVGTCSRDSNSGPHDCKVDALPQDHGHHTFGASTGVVPRKQNRERLV